jgi:4-diphosphocytidyl-2-C-methyl-D-erythritol kinase
VTVRSYAKINLGLRILGKRPDGYHELVTVFHCIDLYDTLTFTLRDSGAEMDCDAPDLPCDGSNLCIRAANAVLEIAGHGGVHITLRKRIPVGAGLGGGSSNAAAVLRTLPGMLGLRITDAELHAIAAGLGSDVAFFLHHRSAEARGRGEILRPVVFPFPWWIVTVFPDIHVSTAQAYGALRPEHYGQDTDFVGILRQAVDDDSSLATGLLNDFEAAVMQQWPAIRDVRDALLRDGAAASLMSGSGSSVFGLFRNERDARAVMSNLPSGMTISLTAPDFYTAFP